MLTKKTCACLLALLFLLQGPAYLSANANASQRSAVVAEPVDDAVAEVESYSLSEKSTDEVNAFLAGNSIRSQFLANLTSKGVDPDAVKYIAAKSNPAAGGADDLTLLTNNLNQNIAPGSPSVTSTEMWFGAYEHADGRLDGSVLMVANLSNGDQRLLSAIQADDNALNSLSTPTAVAGDYFASAAVTGASPQQQAAVVALICWINCIVIQQIIVILRCIVITILLCVRIGPFIACIGVRITICRIIIIIRTIVICWINCVLIVVVKQPVQVVPDSRVGLLPGGRSRSVSDNFPGGLKKSEHKGKKQVGLNRMIPSEVG
jgi:hypothetical protein